MTRLDRNDNSLFHTFIENSENPIAHFDSSLHYLYANSQWRLLFQLKNADYQKTSYITTNGASKTFERDILLGLSGKPIKKQNITLKINGSTHTVDYTIDIDTLSTSPKAIACLKVTESYAYIAEQTKSRMMDYLNLSNNIFLQLDQKGRIELINEAGAKLLGYHNQELIGKNWIETAIAEKDHTKYKQVLAAIFDGNLEAFRHVEFEIISAYSAVYTISWNNTVLRNKENKITSLLTNGNNITATKDALNKLGKSEDKFKSLADSITDVFFSINRKFEVTYWNSVSEKTSGIASDQILGNNFFETAPEYNTTNIRSLIEWSVERQKVGHAIEDLTQNGINIAIDINIYPYNDGVSILIRDISKQIKFQEQIFEQAQILDQLNEAVITTDQAGNITSLNSPSQIIFGNTYKNLIGIHISSLFNLASRNLLKTILDNLSDMHSFAADELNIIGKDKTVFPALIHISQKRDIKRYVNGYIFSIIDISETAAIRQEILTMNQNLEETIRKRTTELELAKIKAEQANQSKTDFLANMSHEVRTPMNSIVGLNQMLLNDTLTEKQRDYVSKIAKSSESLLSLINSILDYTRFESGDISFNYHDFSLNNLFQILKQKLLEQIGLKKIKAHFILDSATPSIIHSDATRLQQALMILLDNAVKFTNKGEINLSIKSSPAPANRIFLHIEISDTGIGINKNLEKTLFSPFTQADTSKTRKYGGAGIGLALCSQIIKKLGGTVSFKKNSAHGSIFSISLQVVAHKGEEKINNFHLCNQTVLIIESNKKNQTALENILSTAQAKIINCSSIDEVLITLQKNTNEKFNSLIIDQENFTAGYNQIKQELLEKYNLQIICCTTGNFIIPDNFSKDIVFLHLPILSNEILPLLSSTPPVNIEEIQQGKPNSNMSIHNFDFTRMEVLVVDDNAINAEIAREILKTKGITVDIASNGIEALQKIDSHSYDLVLMDIKMPLMGGIEAVTKLRLEKKMMNLPVIAISADITNDNLKKYTDAGMNGFIKKPFDVSNLFSTISKWIPKSISIPKEAIIINEHKKRHIDGINIHKLQLQINSTDDKVTEILKMFYDNNLNRIVELKEYHNSDNIEKLLELSHNLLSVSGNIGADDLYAAVLLYNKALTKKEINTNFLFADLCYQLDRTLTSVNRHLIATLKSCQILEVGVGAPSPSEIEQLQQYLIKSDTRSLVYLDQLLKKNYANQANVVLQEIKNYSLKFDFDNALTYFTENKGCLEGE